MAKERKKLDFEIADEKLLALTEKFLEEFFQLHHEVSEVKEKRPHGDSFAFNYVLAEMLSKTKYAKVQEGYPLLDMGFSQNVAKYFFNNQLQGFTDQVVFLINNFKNQEPYEDYKATHLNVKKENIEKDDYDFDLSDGTLHNFKVNKKDVVLETTSFFIYNGKSGVNHKIVLKKELGEFREIVSIEIFTLNNEKVLHIGYKMDDLSTIKSTFTEKGEIQHFKYVADINSAISNVETVCILIEEYKKTKKKKKATSK